MCQQFNWGKHKGRKPTDHDLYVFYNPDQPIEKGYFYTQLLNLIRTNNVSRIIFYDDGLCVIDSRNQNGESVQEGFTLGDLIHDSKLCAICINKGI